MPGAYEQAAAALLKLHQGMQDFETGAKMTRAELESLLSVNAQQLLAQFDQLTAKGKSTEDAIKAMTGSFDPTSLESVRGYGQALSELQTTGRLSAEQVGGAWSQALAKLDGQQLAAFQAAASAAFGSSERDAQALGVALDTAVRQAIANTGQDWDKLATGIGDGAGKALGNLDTLTGGLDRLKAAGVDTSTALSGAIDVAVQAADSRKALDALQARVEALGRQGEISGEQTTKALDAIARKADEVTPGINSVAEAFKALGIKSQQELDKAAATAKEAFDVIANSGEASASQLQQSFMKYAQAAIEANGGVADSSIEVQSAMYDVQLSADSTGKTIAKAVGDSTKSMTDLVGEIDKVATGLDRVASSAGSANQAMQDSSYSPLDTYSQGGSSDASGSSTGAGPSYAKLDAGTGNGTTGGLPDWAMSYAGIYAHAKSAGLNEGGAKYVANYFMHKRPQWSEMRGGTVYVWTRATAVDHFIADAKAQATAGGTLGHFAKDLSGSTGTGTSATSQDTSTTSQTESTGVSGSSAVRKAETITVYRIDLNYQGRQLSIPTTNPTAGPSLADLLAQIERDKRSAA